jgi:hypothetical protein
MLTKSLWVNSSSREVSGRVFSSSSEERFTIGISLEGPPCSRTGEGGLREDTSSGDTVSGRDSDGDGNGVEAPLNEDEELLPEERERLMPLFSSIMNK